jgi:hypothetical protein
MSTQPGLASWRHLNRWQRKALPTLGLLLGFMSLNRFLLYRISLPWFEGATWEELALVFGMGLRFDLLVLGFLAMPLVVLSIFLRRMDRLGDLALRGLVACWGTLWTLVVLATVVSHGFFSATGRQLTFLDLGSPAWKGAELVGFFGSASGVLLVAIAACEISIGWREWGRVGGRIQSDREALRAESPEPGEGWRAVVPRLLGPLLLAGLAARGTVTPHHLEKQHSLVSSNPALNQLVLNAVWSFDKKPDAL